MKSPLTKSQYEKLIDAYHAGQKERLLARYDTGAQLYGPLDLEGGRNWMTERTQELDDALAYELFERERLRRAAARASTIGYRVP